MRALLVFGAGFVIGALAGIGTPTLLDNISDAFMQEFGANPGHTVSLAQDIFIRNLTASAIALIGGIIFGIAPFFVLLINGFLLGYVMFAVTAHTSPNHWENFFTVLIGILPHGIIELPAIIIAAGLGLQLGLRWFTDSRGHKLKAFKSSLISAIYVAPIVIAMLAIAALIEVFVTGRLLS